MCPLDFFGLVSLFVSAPESRRPAQRLDRRRAGDDEAQTVHPRKQVRTLFDTVARGTDPRALRGIAHLDDDGGFVAHGPGERRPLDDVPVVEGQSGCPWRPASSPRWTCCSALRAAAAGHADARGVGAVATAGGRNRAARAARGRSGAMTETAGVDDRRECAEEIRAIAEEARAMVAVVGESPGARRALPNVLLAAEVLSPAATFGH